MLSDNTKLLPFFIVIIIIVICLIFFLIKDVKSKNVSNLNKKQKTLRVVSLVLTFLGTIFLIPMIGIFFMAGIATIMMSDSGVPSDLHSKLIFIGILLFWGTPIIAFVSIILSFLLRKIEKYLLSIIIQLAPVVTTLIAFGIVVLYYKI